MIYKIIRLSTILCLILFLSGCIDKTPTRANLEDSQLVDSYCRSKGYEYGATKYLRSGERWNVLDGSLQGNMAGITMTETSVECIRAKTEYNVFLGRDFKDYIDKVIYLNNT